VSPTAARVTAFAPGSIGNVGPGLDILGLAVAGAGDEVTAVRTSVTASSSKTRVTPISRPTRPGNTAALAARESSGESGSGASGLALTVRKGLPLAGGQAAAPRPPSPGCGRQPAAGRAVDLDALLAACLEAEATVAGRHADNVAPRCSAASCWSAPPDPPDVVRLAVPRASGGARAPRPAARHEGVAQSCRRRCRSRPRCTRGGAGRRYGGGARGRRLCPIGSGAGRPDRRARAIAAAAGVRAAKRAALAAERWARPFPAAARRRSQLARGEAAARAAGTAMREALRRGRSRRQSGSRTWTGPAHG
jgi:hypothetical protein